MIKFHLPIMRSLSTFENKILFLFNTFIILFLVNFINLNYQNLIKLSESNTCNSQTHSTTNYLLHFKRNISNQNTSFLELDSRNQFSLHIFLKCKTKKFLFLINKKPMVHVSKQSISSKYIGSVKNCSLKGFTILLSLKCISKWMRISSNKVLNKKQLVAIISI